MTAPTPQRREVLGVRRHQHTGKVMKKQWEGNDSLGVCCDPDAALSSCLLLLKGGPPNKGISLLEGEAGAKIGQKQYDPTNSQGVFLL